MGKRNTNPPARPIREHIDSVVKVLCSECERGRTGTLHNPSYGRSLETVFAEELRGYLPSKFGVEKNSFIRTSQDPFWESSEIDIVLTNKEWGSPLAITKEYKVFPIETIMGIILITGYLDGDKLEEDFEVANQLQKLKTRYYDIPITIAEGIAEKLGISLDGHIHPDLDIRNQRVTINITDLPPRFFYIAYKTEWKRDKTIIKNIENVLEKKNDVVLHGMYILNQGFYRSTPGKRLSVDSDTRPEAFLTFLHVLLDSLHTFNYPPPLATLPLNLYGSAAI